MKCTQCSGEFTGNFCGYCGSERSVLTNLQSTGRQPSPIEQLIGNQSNHKEGCCAFDPTQYTDILATFTFAKNIGQKVNFCEKCGERLIMFNPALSEPKWSTQPTKSSSTSFPIFSLLTLVVMFMGFREVYLLFNHGGNLGWLVIYIFLFLAANHAANNNHT